MTSEVLICTGFSAKTTTKGSLEIHQAIHRHAMATGLSRLDFGRQTLVYDQKSGHFIKGIALNYSELVGFPYISPGRICAAEVLIWTGFCEITTKGFLENHQATHRHAMATGVRQLDSGRLTLAYNQKSGYFIKGIALNYSELVGFPYISPGKDLRSGSFNLDWILRNHHLAPRGLWKITRPPTDMLWTWDRWGNVQHII